MAEHPSKQQGGPAHDSLVTDMVTRLKRGLNASLTYHSPAHTEDVIQQALALAQLDSLDDHSMLLIAIAAAFHDAGFLSARLGHEAIGADMASQAMGADNRFSQTDIGLVVDMIMDTRVNQAGSVHCCTTHLSPWLLDADLANFGRDDFFDQTRLVAEENQIEAADMIASTIDLMDRHTWQSPAGLACFESKKQENRRLLTQALS